MLRRAMNYETLRPILVAMYDDVETPIAVVATALIPTLRWRRLARGLRDVPHLERECLTVLELDECLAGDGFEQWVRVGYVWNAADTVRGLQRLGAPWAAELVERAVDALPPRFRAALTECDHSVDFKRLPSSPRREALFQSLSDRYTERCAQLNGGLEAVVVAYARAFRVGVKN